MLKGGSQGPRPPGRRGPLRSWAANFALFALSTSAGLGALELGARLLLTQRTMLTTGEQGVYTEWDQELGWKNRPHAKVRYSRREYSSEIVINSLGFRDVERSIKRPVGTGRVLALGDSFIEGYTVELEESATRRAEAMARARGCAVEFVNAGVHAYSTDQEALWYQREGAALGADVVLLFVYYNDILNNVRANYWGLPKPVTRVVGGRIEAVNLPLPLPKETEEAKVQRVAPRVIEGSALKATIGGRLLLGFPDLYNLLSRTGLWDKIEPDAIPDELRAYKVRGQLAEMEQAWTRTRELVEALGGLVRARHARPVLAYVPARFEISERDWRLTRLRYGIDSRVWDPRRVRTRLQEIADEARWPFLDLTPDLRASVGILSGEPYLQFDGHWNAEGHAVVGRAMVDFLSSRSWLPCGEEGHAERPPIPPPSVN